MSNDDIVELIDQVRMEFTEAECEAELIDAARHGDVDVVRAVLHVHPRLIERTQDSHNNTPLHMSAANGHVTVTKVLIEHGANVTATNDAGNTPLHWASTNGHGDIVQLLLQNNNNNQQIDVLQQNQFGRSALTEGFTSQNMDVVKTLLEHDSASEERLIQPAGKQGAMPIELSSCDDTQSDDDGPNRMTTTTTNTNNNSIVHQLVFQGIEIEAREIAIAESERDTILGQANPADDTTGLGIWASSLVLAQWLVSQVKGRKTLWTQQSCRSSSSRRVVVELGAGCGVPSLALSKAMSSLLSPSCSNYCGGGASSSTTSLQIYATDFSPRTVDNLQYNIDRNTTTTQTNTGGIVTVEAKMMNWQDPNTWPKEPVDCLIGSDLIYQSDMVPVLIQTIVGLLQHHDDNDNDNAETHEEQNEARFLYVARTDGQRLGHAEFLAGMESANFIRREYVAPMDFTLVNPLASQDDDLCYLYFHELATTQYTLYEFFHRRS